MLTRNGTILYMFPPIDLVTIIAGRGDNGRLLVSNAAFPSRVNRSGTMTFIPCYCVLNVVVTLLMYLYIIERLQIQGFRIWTQTIAN